MQKVFIFGLLFLTLSCGHFRKFEKSQDWRIKYEAGLNYYSQKEYYRTSVLFEQILPIVRGLPEGEKVQFYLAYSYFYQKQYLIGSEHFKTFFETYGRSTLAEEARYQYAYSLYLSSPDFNLDQTSSIQAMAAMQEFLNRFPNSSFREKSIEVITTIQEKLEKKGFENARQYYKMRWYNAGIVALNNFKNNFPDSKYLEEAYFLVVACEYKLAQQSVPSKQLPRYQSVLGDYKEFIDRFPESEFGKEAEKYYLDSMAWINKNNNS